MRTIKKQQKNDGFTLIELIIVVAILATIVGILAPSYLKYVDKAKRVADVHTAQEIRNAYERIIATSDPGTSACAWNYTCAVMWNSASKMPDPSSNSLNVVEQGFLELGEVPLSKVNKDYFWLVEYDTVTGSVKKIYLTSSPMSRIKYELYPNSDAFLGNDKK